MFKCKTCKGKGIVTSVDFNQTYEESMLDIPCPRCKKQTPVKKPLVERGKEIIFALRYWKPHDVRYEPITMGYFYYIEEEDGRISRIPEKELDLE